MIDLLDQHFARRGSGVEFEMEADWVHCHLGDRRGLMVEVGCGIGALLHRMGVPGAIGLDHNAAGLALTRKQLGLVPLICAAAERLPFGATSLDVITAQHVLEHIESYENACQEWFGALKRGGLLLVLTPNGEFRDPTIFDDPTHVVLFDQRHLRGVLEGVGFEIVDLRTLGLPWFRRYHGIPAGWRFRRLVTEHAGALSRPGPWRWKGQTLCCAARRPRS